MRVVVTTLTEETLNEKQTGSALTSTYSLIMVSTLYFAVKDFSKANSMTQSRHTHPPGKLNASPGTNSVASGFKPFP